MKLSIIKFGKLRNVFDIILPNNYSVETNEEQFLYNLALLYAINGGKDIQTKEPRCVILEHPIITIIRSHYPNIFNAYVKTLRGTELFDGPDAQNVISTIFPQFKYVELTVRLDDEIKALNLSKIKINKNLAYKLMDEDGRV
jgi:hypothetical protein